jgi:hypothetical protein
MSCSPARHLRLTKMSLSYKTVLIVGKKQYSHVFRESEVHFCAILQIFNVWRLNVIYRRTQAQMTEAQMPEARKTPKPWTNFLFYEEYVTLSVFALNIFRW